MAGRRRRKDPAAEERLVVRHRNRKQAFQADMQAAGSDSVEALAAAGQYLRGAVRVTQRTIPAEGATTARHAAAYLAERADELFEAAIAARRKSR